MKKEESYHWIKKDTSKKEEIKQVPYPLRKDADSLSKEEKIKKIEMHFSAIMEVLGLDLSDDSLSGTPRRVAKMYVNEIFKGLDLNHTQIHSTFKNKYAYNQMLIEKNIIVYSTCEHHFLPIVGKAHVAYISKGDVIGLSKINRIVDYYAKRPQTQERLTLEIVRKMQEILDSVDVACMIDAKHLCVNSRGIQDVDSSTLTYELEGEFRDNPIIRKEFFSHVHSHTHFGI